MASQAQIAANQCNARNSTGPRTEDGKHRVSLNRVTHGLAGNHLILPGENPDDYQCLLDGLVEAHKPRNATELFLVRQMAHAQWKLDRVAAMETSIFAARMPEPGADGAAAAFADDCARSEVLLKLSRYETAARRAWYKALDQLLVLQAPCREQEFQQAVDDEVSKFVDRVINGPVPAAPPMPAAPEDEDPEDEDYDSNPTPDALPDRPAAPEPFSPDEPLAPQPPLTAARRIPQRL